MSAAALAAVHDKLLTDARKVCIGLFAEPPPILEYFDTSDHSAPRLGHGSESAVMNELRL
ncbi:hypothetical protein AB0M50_14905 [Nonomuraea fuscirosea]|uniref:hypothetical protein n=1 Tax=Nonomuraea fuscirosea TaxID=1291556 RepID=UPI0034142FEB